MSLSLIESYKKHGNISRFVKKAAACAAAAVVVLTVAAALPTVPSSAYENEPEWYASPAAEDGYIISTAKNVEEFFGLVKQGCDFYGKTVYLTEDVTITVAIGADGVFKGTFNALGNTVTLSAKSKTAFFASLEDAKIMNLRLVLTDGMTIEQEKYGAVLAKSAKSTLFEGCMAGGTVSFAAAEGYADPLYPATLAGFAEGCTFRGCMSTASNKAGDLPDGIAFAPFGAELKDCTVERCIAAGAPKLYIHNDGSTFSGVLTLAVPEEEIPGVLTYDPGTVDETLTALNESEPGESIVWSADSEGVISFHMHDYGKSMSAADCLTNVVCSFVCDGCGDRSLTYITAEKGAHTPGEDEGEVTPATCTEEGYTTHTCAVCSEQYKTDITPATGHTIVKINIVAPTCVDYGFSGDRVCTVCGYKRSGGSKVKPTGIHTWENPTVTTAPTGDTDGVLTYYCKYCDATNEEAVPKLGHTLGDFEYYDAQTHGALCSCGEYIYRAHEWVLKSRTEPTVEQAGLEVHRCGVCGGEKSNILDAIGHTVSSWTSVDAQTHGGYCTCGEYISEEHQWDAGEVISSSAEGGAVRTLYKCLKCGEQQVRETPASPGAEGKTESERPQAVRMDRKKYLIAGALLLLLIGGIAVTVYIRRTDRY